MRPIDSDPYLISFALDRERVPSFDRYPFNVPVIKNLDTLKLHPKVTFFVGDNGTGKSTLLEAIAVVFGFNPEGGSRDFRFSTYESHSELCEYIELDWGRGLHKPKDNFFLRAESYYNVITEAKNLESRLGFHHSLSHGEAFLALLTDRFFGNGLYILDEPEAALSPLRQMSVLSIINKLVRKKSQFIIATHSPIIMAYPDSTIYHFSEDAIREIDYTETEHYQITCDFLNRRETMLRVLLREE